MRKATGAEAAERREQQAGGPALAGLASAGAVQLRLSCEAGEAVRLAGVVAARGAQGCELLMN